VTTAAIFNADAEPEAGDDIEKVTELEKFGPERMDGVNGPANGYPALMLKSLADAPEPPATTTQQEGHIAAVTTEPDRTDAAVEPEASPPTQAAKSRESDTVTVELPKDVSMSFSPADLAKLTTFKQRLIREQAVEGETTKRNFDPNVGGGVDRDKIPAEDFGDPEHRAFPIVKPGDVADVGPNLNRPNLKGDPEKIKQRVMAIARRKGPKFEAEIPDSWKGGTKKSAGEPAEEAVEKKGKKPFTGAAPAFDGTDSDHDGADADTPGSEEDDDTRKPPKAKPGSARKGVKDCPECGKTYHADSKQRTCENCGHDLPSADAAAKATACKACTAPMAKGAKFCSACGVPAGKKTKKGNDPSPEDAAVSVAISRLKDDVKAALDAQEKDPDAETHPADAAVAAHLEDAKDAISAAEDAQEDDIDSDDEDAHEAAAKAAEPPAYHLARLHDATCAAYHHDDVAAAHPLVAKGLAALADPAPFAAMVTAALTEDAGTGSRMADLPSLSAAYHCAVAMKAASAHDGLLDDAMADLRKAFADYYPDAHPKPGSVTPGTFHRPYIATGRANQAAKPGQKPRVPLASHVPSPDDFRRPLITAGREAASPGSKPSGVGKARMYYSNDGRGQAATVLAAMHDWIADNHPTICPMKGAPYDNEPGVDVNSMASTLTTAQPMPKRMTATQATASPTPVGAGHAASVVTPGPTRKNKADKAAAKEERKMAKAAQRAQEAAATSAPLIDPEMFKSILREVVADEIGELKTTLGEHEKRIAEWESAPDPAQMTPRNGAAALGKARETSHEVPAGGDGPSEQRLMRLMKQTMDPDSGNRVAAIGELTELLGREKAVELLAAAH
jgi:hypothetical protein